MTRIQKCLDQTQLESFVRSYSFVRFRKKIEMLFAHLKRGGFQLIEGTCRRPRRARTV